MAYEPEDIARYEAARATGLNRYQAAIKAGVPPTNVYRWEKKEEVRENIEKLAQQYISKLPDAIQLSHRIIDSVNNMDDETFGKNTKMIELASKEADMMRKSVGIAPTHAPSVVIGQLVLGDQTIVVDANVQRLLDGLSDTVDITPDSDTT